VLLVVRDGRGCIPRMKMTEAWWFGSVVTRLKMKGIFERRGKVYVASFGTMVQRRD
jgi:hypothetical protein